MLRSKCAGGLALLTLVGVASLAVRGAPAPASSDLKAALERARKGELRGVEEPLLDRVKKDDPGTPKILEALGEGYLQTYRYHDAVECAEELLRRKDDDPRALLLRGRAREGLARLEKGWGAVTGKAQEDYSRVLELDPKRDEARLLLAKSLVLARNPQEAVTEFQVLRTRRPKDGEVLLGLAHCQMELGNLEEAEEFLAALPEQDSKSAPALAERGRLALENDRPGEAEAMLRKAVELDPFDSAATYSLIQAIRRGGKDKDFDRELTRLEKIQKDRERLDELTAKMDKSPHDAALDFEIASIFLRNGRDKSGLRWLKYALLEDPKHRAAHRALAEYYERAGSKDLAERHRRLAEQE